MRYGIIADTYDFARAKSNFRKNKLKKRFNLKELKKEKIKNFKLEKEIRELKKKIKKQEKGGV